MAASPTVLDSPHVCNSITPKHGVVTLIGFGIRVAVERGHLILADGIGDERRCAKFARVYNRLKRLVVIGSDGVVSLAALRWLADQDVAFVMLERDGTVLATTGPVRPYDARLRRAQALAENNGAGLQIAIDLIRQKLAGQQLVAREKLDNPEIADEIENRKSELDSAKTLNTILSIESRAALSYWSAWSNVPIEFSKLDSSHIPEHWRKFGARISPITSSPRLAVNPPNAVLNYLYAILEAEARLAAAELGLDPGIGVLHRDRPNRDSLACDLMEPLRALADAYLFDFLSRGPLRKEWFFEKGDGNCRLMGEFAAQFSETSAIWRKAIGPVAERVAKILWQSRTKRSSFREIPSRLTQTKRSEGRNEYPKAAPVGNAPRSPWENRCPICGAEIRKNAQCCAGCAPLVGRANLLQAAKLGRIAGHTPTAEARRSATHMKQVEAQKKWNPSDLPEWLDEDFYKTKIVPKLFELTAKKIKAEIDVSHPYAILIRKGLRIPHPRHWWPLAKVAGMVHGFNED